MSSRRGRSIESIYTFGGRRRMVISTPIPENRPLTAAEVTLVRWLLQHGTPQASGYLPQLDRARVASRCYCGCASIDFAIDNLVPPPGDGISILADYEWRAAGGELFGVFVFERSGLLAGLEVWSQDGLAQATSLPDIEQLRPVGTCQIAEQGFAPDCGGSTGNQGSKFHQPPQQVNLYVHCARQATYGCQVGP